MSFISFLWNWKNKVIDFISENSCSVTFECLSNISGISNTTLKCDLLFNLPKSEDCEGKRTYNLTLGLNVLFQQFGDPILGIGASIPFDN